MLQDHEKIYLERLRKLSGEKRMEITSELFDTIKEIAKAGIKHQNPQISSKKLAIELTKRLAK
ncbi:MAG: hypothetical protein E3J54_01555 [Actinobacteria bacterium]|nr:MAG: hypothetical protein E3J54_01555 [Actinomycetota bacterium]